MLAIPIVLFLAFVAWVFLERTTLYPRQYEHLQREAEAWKRKNWETGSALRVTVQVSSDAALGGRTARATVHCYRKRFAREGGLKGPPGAPAIVMSDGPEQLDLPFGPDATHVTPLRDVCFDALRDSDDWHLPHVTESHYYWSHIVARDQSFRCFLGNDPRTSRGNITRPTFVGLEQVPLRGLLTRQAYEALSYRDTGAHVPPPPTYYWLTQDVETECWRTAPRDSCAAAVAAVCGTPRR